MKSYIWKLSQLQFYQLMLNFESHQPPLQKSRQEKKHDGMCKPVEGFNGANQQQPILSCRKLMHANLPSEHPSTIPSSWIHSSKFCVHRLSFSLLRRDFLSWGHQHILKALEIILIIVHFFGLVNDELAAVGEVMKNSETWMSHSLKGST